MTPEEARLGFIIMTVMRLGGIAFAALGLAILAGKLHAPAVFGGGLAVFGVIEALLLPALLARRWRSRDR